MNVFVNYSNHPFSTWSKEQQDAIQQFHPSTIVDIQFPQIDSNATEMDVVALAKEQLEMIFRIYEDAENIIIHIMGEMTFVAYFVSMINKYHGFKAICIASTTERIVEEKDGKKISTFQFKRFRQYLTR
jgi:hypothetical protein